MEEKGRKAYFTSFSTGYLFVRSLQSAIFMLSSLLMGNRFDRIILPRADKIAQSLIIDLLDKSDEFRDLGIKGNETF